MQMAVIEAARSLAGIADANSTEFGPTAEPVVGLLTEWLHGNELEQRAADGDLGGTMRLGAYPARAGAGLARSPTIYGATEISERHRHRYEVNMAYRERLEAQGPALLRPVAGRPAARDRRVSPTIPGSSACSSTRS